MIKALSFWPVGNALSVAQPTLMNCLQPNAGDAAQGKSSFGSPLGSVSCSPLGLPQTPTSHFPGREILQKQTRSSLPSSWALQALPGEEDEREEGVGSHYLSVSQTQEWSTWRMQL